MKLGNSVWWVIHDECPISQRFQRERRLAILAAMTVALENALSEEQLQNWLLQDTTSQTIEAFSFDTTKVIKLRKYGEPLAFP
jgi:hypothetical protein